MNILEDLKKGATVEDITENFFEALEEAQKGYEQWLKEEEEKAAAAEAKRQELEYKKMKQEQARAALGAAIVNYFESLGIVITESMMKDIDDLIELLPHLKLYRPGKIWEEFWK